MLLLKCIKFKYQRFVSGFRQISFRVCVSKEKLGEVGLGSML